MAVCSIEFSPEVAFAGARSFFWRKFATPFGALLLISLLVLLGFAAAVLRYDDGAAYAWPLVAMVVANVGFQVVSYVRDAPRLAKRIEALEHRTAEVETSETGIRVSLGQKSGVIPWKAYGPMWIDRDFILIARRPPVAGCLVVPTRGMTPEVLNDFEIYGHAKKSPN